MEKNILIIFFVLIAGCTHFQTKPILPSETASAFESRTLDNHLLKEFLETNLHHKITPWPPKFWDFLMLTLVAFYYHPDLDVVRAQWDVAQSGVITAGGHPNPNVGFLPEYSTNAASGISPWVLGFTFNVPLETGGKRGYRIAQAQQLSEVARLNIAIVAWRVRSRLKTALLNFYAANQTETILKKQQAIQEEIVQVLAQRLTAGEVPLPDVTQAHISLKQIRLALGEAQKQVAETHVQLANALGLPVSALAGINISFEFLEHIPLVADLPSQEVRRQALFNRPDILAALAEYEASQTALQLEIAKQYPDIHLGPGYTYDQGENKWSLGFSVTLPVFNRNEGPIAKAEARRKETQARFTALQTQVIGEIDRTLAGYRAALENLEIADSLLLFHKKRLQSVQALFGGGETDRLALLSSQAELESTELARLNIFVKAQQSLNLLEDAMQHPLQPLKPFPIVPETDPRTKEADKNEAQ